MSDPDPKDVHAAAAAGFAAGATTYAAGRPEYPSEVEGWLADDLRLGPGRAVLDLGAGTGKFLTRLRAPARRFTPSSPCRKCCRR